jgi:hypothetical protein
MSELTITQDADGTLVHGSDRGDGTAEVVKLQGFRWGRSISCWYFPRNRRPLTLVQLDQLADRLRAAGHTVHVEAQDATTADREAARSERIEDRQEALAAKAERREAASEAALAAADRISDMIPFGQPVLVGHHSQRRHERDLDRIHRNTQKGWDLHREANLAASRADASRGNQRHRESAPATIRRIERMEADLRRFDRSLFGCTTSGAKVKPERVGTEVSCPHCWDKVTIQPDATVPNHRRPEGVERTHLQEQRDRLADEIAYWREHLATLQAQGAKVYSRDDVQKGDQVVTRFGLRTVVRVNPKSVSVQTDYSWTDTVKYDEVRGVFRDGEKVA